MSFFVVTPHLTIADRIIWFAWRVFMALSLLAVALMAGMAFAQTAPAAPAEQPVWLTLVLALAPWVIGALVSVHPMLKLGAWLHALAQRTTGTPGKLLELASVTADDVDAYLTKNGQSLKDLVDPAKRAAAEEALIADAKAEAKQAVDDALKRALPVG
jgi:hypothetical protein